MAVGDRTTLIELYEMLRLAIVINDANCNRNPIFRDFRNGDVKKSMANIDKIKKLINYEPTHTLKNGLLLAISWVLSLDK